jgi:uncharacterized membrane-anchored protein
MKILEEIKKELHYQIKQGFLDYSLNAETNPVRIAFVNGYIMALKWVLEDNENVENN